MIAKVMMNIAATTHITSLFFIIFFRMLLTSPWASLRYPSG